VKRQKRKNSIYQLRNILTFNFPFCNQEDDQYYDEGGEKDGEEAEQTPVPVPVPETTPILPTRVVPTLLSPSFEDESTVDGGSLSMSSKPIDANEMIAPTKMFSEPPKIYSSISFPVSSVTTQFESSYLSFNFVAKTLVL
jgi:hypothetical protein